MSKMDEMRHINIRRQNIVYLMQHYLYDNGFYNAAEALGLEAGIDENYELCDNIDLDSIYLEYASYQQLKFGKFPSILRKVRRSMQVDDVDNSKQSKNASNSNGEGAAAAQAQTTGIESDDLPSGSNFLNNTSASVPSDCISVELFKLQQVQHGSNLTMVDNCAEWHALVGIVRATIMHDNIGLTWSDIEGNGELVQLVKEAVIWPLKNPQYFTNGLKPWRSMLIHGPPGTGKTQLAKTLYAETRNAVTFFNVSASIIISKWRGDSEKLVRILFSLARQHAPSIIFFDEIEGLTSPRDRPGDHESTKRFKNELLQLLDGMEAIEMPISASVFVLASTNLPWEVDPAFLRRFEKKILVELPNRFQREYLIKKLLPASVPMSPEGLNSLARLSEHFTGDEIRLACKEVAMQIRRRACAGLPDEFYYGDSGMDYDASIEMAFLQIKPLCAKLMAKHVQWQDQYGS